MKKKYEVILLDADGTILDFDKAQEDALKNTLEFFGIVENFEEIKERYDVINAKLWKDLEKGSITKDKIKTERFQKLSDELNLKLDGEKCGSKYLEYLGKTSFLLDGAKELCKYLKERYQVIIVTNGIKKVQESRFAASLLMPYIDALIVSEDVGVNKPDPYIFEHALNVAKNPDKSKVLMVGDSLTADIGGGNSFGLDTCWVNLKDKKAIKDMKPTYEINGLHEMYEIV